MRVSSAWVNTCHQHILTNADLEKRMDTSDEWIRTMTGIEERRIADDSIRHIRYGI